MSILYRVRNFSEYYETAESRKLQRLSWIALPTKQEGDGYTELMGGHENGCAHFGAWTAILQLASKCSPRGTLLRNLGGRLVPHDAASISRITRVPISVLIEAIPRLLEMGWMEEIEQEEVVGNLPKDPGEPGDGSKKPGSTGQGQDRGGQDRTAQQRGVEDTPPPPLASPNLNTTPEDTLNAKKQKRRADLLIIIKGHNAKLTMGSENIFEEWIDVTDGFQLDWITHLMDTVRPRIKLPSALRVELNRKSGLYQEWIGKQNKETKQ